MHAFAKCVMELSRLNIAMATPGSSKWNTLVSTPVPLSSLNESVSVPFSFIRTSVAWYWSKQACLPMMIGSFQEFTKGGMFLHRMGSLKTVPPRVFLMVPLGDLYIFLRSNSFTRSASGVIVAHLTPTPYSFMAAAASVVIASFVESLCWMLKSYVLRDNSKKGRRSFPFTFSHRTAAISSPRSSTIGVSTFILPKVLLLYILQAICYERFLQERGSF